MILEDLENFKQDLRHQEKKEKTKKQKNTIILTMKKLKILQEQM